MLTIHIVGFDSSNKLKLEVNGRPNKGHSTAESGWQVQWIVRDNSGIEGISDIKIKEIPGSTDIFSDNPPEEHSGPKHWKGRINRDARDYSVYVYKIEWFKGKGEEKLISDPIISIKPKSTSFFKVLLGIIAGIFCLFLFTGKKKRRFK